MHRDHHPASLAMHAQSVPCLIVWEGFDVCEEMGRLVCVLGAIDDYPVLDSPLSSNHRSQLACMPDGSVITIAQQGTINYKDAKSN